MVGGGTSAKVAVGGGTSVNAGAVVRVVAGTVVTTSGEAVLIGTSVVGGAESTADGGDARAGLAVAAMVGVAGSEVLGATEVAAIAADGGAFCEAEAVVGRDELEGS